MAVSSEAERNHEVLFPGRVSTLQRTNPEVIEYFDNFAFDEALRHGTLDIRTRLMVQLASMIALQALAGYRVMLGAALTVGVSPIEVKEIIYQAVPLVGCEPQVKGHVTANIHVGNDRRRLIAPTSATCAPSTRCRSSTRSPLV